MYRGLVRELVAHGFGKGVGFRRGVLEILGKFLEPPHDVLRIFGLLRFSLCVRLGFLAAPFQFV